MNKVITEGVVLMPPAFSDGLGNWSSGDGTPGSDTYDGAVNAAFVPADANFAGCLELQKTEVTQQLRSMGADTFVAGVLPADTRARESDERRLCQVCASRPGLETAEVMLQGCLKLGRVRF